MAPLSSGQYANLLIDRLRRSFRVQTSDNSGALLRIFYSGFFQKLLTHESVEIDEDSFNAFADLMDSEMAYVSGKGYYNFEQVYYDDRKGEQWVFMKNCFSAIGIGLVWEQRLNDEITRTEEIPKINDSNYTRTYIIFILPDQSEMELNAGTMYSNVYINTHVHTTYRYSQKIQPYYEIEPVVGTPSLTGAPMVAGSGTTWEYDPDTETLEIGGSGTLTRSTLFTSSSYFGLKVSRLIIGAGVSGLNDYERSYSFTTTTVTASLSYPGERTIVYFRGRDEDCDIVEPTFGRETHWTVYTDNRTFINTVTSWVNDMFSVDIYPLSAWNG